MQGLSGLTPWPRSASARGRGRDRGKELGQQARYVLTAVQSDRAGLRFALGSGDSGEHPGSNGLARGDRPAARGQRQSRANTVAPYCLHSPVSARGLSASQCARCAMLYLKPSLHIPLDYWKELGCKADFRYLGKISNVFNQIRSS